MNYHFFGAKYGEILDAYIRRSFLSQEALREYRDRKLRNFIKYAVKTTPYYAKLFADYGISAEDVRCQKDLSKIPILTKNVVQDNVEDLQSKGAAKKRKFFNQHEWNNRYAY